MCDDQKKSNCCSVRLRSDMSSLSLSVNVIISECGVSLDSLSKDDETGVFLRKGIYYEENNTNDRSNFKYLSLAACTSSCEAAKVNKQ